MSANPSQAPRAREPVHLIHIGWAKAGSSFLQSWFDAHPQIAFSPQGIAGFSNVFDIARQAATSPDTRCRVTSSEALGSPHPIAGLENRDQEPLAQYDIFAAQERGCHLLRDVFPSATILIVTRGFESALISAYSQYVRTEGHRSFADFCGQAGQALHWWNYDHLIRLYEQAFGPANVLLLPYELLRDDAQAFCGAIEDRLGIDPSPVSAMRRNPSIGGASLAWYPRFTRLLNRLPRQGVIRRLYWRAIVGDRLAPVAALLQRIRPLDVPRSADIPPDLLRTAASRCETLRSRPSHEPYLAEYGLTP